MNHKEALRVAGESFEVLSDAAETVSLDSANLAEALDRLSNEQVATVLSHEQRQKLTRALMCAARDAANAALRLSR